MEKIAIKNKNYFSKGNLMNDNELCVNLWFCFDKETRFINAISGQGYFLTDSDEQKSILLFEGRSNHYPQLFPTAKKHTSMYTF